MSLPQPDSAHPALSARGFTEAFPFFLALDSQFLVSGSGPSMAKICTDVQVGAQFCELFALERPLAELSADVLTAHRHSLFLFRHVRTQRLFRAQLLVPDNLDGWIFLASPWFTDAWEVNGCGLTTNDFAVHDSIFDMLQLVQMQRNSVNELRQLTDSLTAERAKLREANARLQSQEDESRKLALIAALTDNPVAVTDEHGFLEWCNAAFLRTGCEQSLEGLRGVPFVELLRRAQTDEKLVTLIERKIHAQQGVSLEITNICNDRRRWFFLELQPMRDANGLLSHFMALQRDITHEKTESARLAIQYEVSQILISNQSFEAGLTKVLRCICQRANFQIGLFWRHEPNDRHLYCFHSWHDPDYPFEAFLKASLQMRCREGEHLPGMAWQARAKVLLEDVTQKVSPRSAAIHAIGLHTACAVPILSDGQCLGIIEFFATRTARIDSGGLDALTSVANQVAQFVARWQAETSLMHAKELAERANEAKSMFLATMSHEVRTPLNAIIGFAEMLLDGQLSARQREDVAPLRRSGEVLLHLINDVLDFARIESGGLTIERVAFKPVELVEQTMQIHRQEAQRKGLQFLWTIAPGIPKKLLGDPTRIRQVLANLLTNAVKFTPSGSVQTEVSTSDGRLCFRVADTGIGFDPSLTERLFEPFQQADASTTQRFGGTGLGLSICHRLVGLMGGGIEARSEPGVGSTFKFWVPLVAAEGSLAEAAVGTAGEPLPDAGGRRVLVAEDNPVNCRLIRLILEKLGCQVSTAANGEEALATFAKHEFAAVLMDLRMPGMDGLEATRRLRAGEAGVGGRRVPIIALTASVLPADRTACARAGADHYLSKPIQRNELIAALDAVGLFEPPPIQQE